MNRLAVGKRKVVSAKFRRPRSTAGGVRCERTDIGLASRTDDQVIATFEQDRSVGDRAVVIDEVVEIWVLILSVVAAQVRDSRQRATFGWDEPYQAIEFLRIGIEVLTVAEQARTEDFFGNWCDSDRSV